ncbi:hypothetical protein CWO84_21885 [Methylomonas sp. Kb3]|nr:hypothetical protein CWO84_21885 [Methylomonas sp. Kb3]
MVNDNSSRFTCKKFFFAVTTIRFLAIFSVIMAIQAVSRGEFFEFLQLASSGLILWFSIFHSYELTQPINDVTDLYRKRKTMKTLNRIEWIFIYIFILGTVGRLLI